MQSHSRSLREFIGKLELWADALADRSQDEIRLESAYRGAGLTDDALASAGQAGWEPWAAQERRIHEDPVVTRIERRKRLIDGTARHRQSEYKARIATLAAETRALRGR